MKNFSQLDEQKYILEFFGDKKGRFLEIGAYDGISYSNTYALLLRGWAGVAYEPGVIYDKLVETVKDFDVVCEQKGVWIERGKMTWWDDGGGALGTTSKKHKEMWEKAGAVFTESVMEVDDWDTVFDKHGENFDFISIDIEGGNLRLARVLPLDRIEQVQMLCIEHDNECEYLLSYFEPAGFSVYHSNALNLILVKK